MRSFDYEPENYRCSHCEHYKKDCLRVDGVTVDFSKPWFKSQSDCGCVCCDFELKDCMVYAKQNWVDFDTYFKEYVENWLPYKNTNKLIYFVLNGDSSVRYGVPLLDYVYGRMRDGDKLNAVEKMYYKQTRSGFGYTLIRESIDGVNL
jgi:hypothetical protein